jgi:VIT1/CCC1 family predicted Fe2+/Mn2+ transporter
LIPLLPYMLVPQSAQALWGSVAVTFAALVAFGALKGRFTGTSVWRSAFETAAIGAVAAAVAFVLARLVSGSPA